MARWMLSFGIEAALALLTARRRRGFMLGSGAPILAATVISFASLENSFDLALSALPLRCWMLAHLLWPAMIFGPSFKAEACRNGDLAEAVDRPQAGAGRMIPDKIG